MIFHFIKSLNIFILLHILDNFYTIFTTNFIKYGLSLTSKKQLFNLFTVSN